MIQHLSGLRFLHVVDAFNVETIIDPVKINQLKCLTGKGYKRMQK